MRKLHLIAKNHMDPSWLRCFTDHFNHPVTGNVIRPYSDVEEMQILEYMDFAEKYGVKYQIEQSLVVKKLLERNPDQKERLKNLIQKGLIEIAGGGETVIDVNLVQGESWARNHLYSIKYYEKEFEHRPKYSITPDIFGLASQLPQFFRSVGYDANILFDRVMLNNKPFWKGLDGTLIVLDNRFLNPPRPGLRTADCVKIGACPACHGEGCELCEGNGIDTTYNMSRPDKEMEKFREAYFGTMSAGEMLQKLIDQEDKSDYFMLITTEEPRVGDYLYGQLNDVAAQYDFEIDYLTFEENHDLWCRGQVEALRSGIINPEDIDTRPEGNPAGCGCYTSRIEIKKANRELEILLEEAEKLAVLAKLNGGWDKNAIPRRDYPQKKLAELWSKMAFIQFHDNVPGSHCDAVYDELMRYIREVRRGGEQIYCDASLELLRKITPEIPEGYNAALCFNTDTTDTVIARLALHAPAGTKSFEIFDTDLNPIPAFDTEIIPSLVGVGARVSVRAAVPSMGYKVFLWKACGEEEKIDTCALSDQPMTIENEYFSVTAENGTITGIYDKKNNRQALSGNIGLAIGDDIGSPWGRAQLETVHTDLKADSIKCECGSGFKRFILNGKLSDDARGIKDLTWTQTVTLNDGEALVRWHNDIDWDGRDTRIFASFPPAFEHSGNVICEVPFGTIERGEPEVINCLGLTDEWPSLGFAGVADGEYNIAVLKGGFAGTRIKDKKLQISIFRAFTTGDPTYAGTNDIGHHASDYALTAWTGTFADGCCSKKAASFNMHGHTQAVNTADPHSCKYNTPVKAGEGCLFPAFTEIPDSVRLSALKVAEDGDGIVARFWESTGKSAVIKMPKGIKLVRCNTLEEETGISKTSEYVFRPFEIATFKVIFE